MTLELCNWVVHMGNWYEVGKGGLPSFTASFLTEIRAQRSCWGAIYHIKEGEQTLHDHGPAIPGDALTLELGNWVVHMGNCPKVHKGGPHTSLHLFSRCAHSVPVGVQYTI